MSPPTSRLFRQEAVRRYVEARENSVLPRFVRPRVFLFVWALAGLLVLSVALARHAEVPRYVDGTGIVTLARRPGSATAGLAVVAALPPASLARVRRGQTLWFRPVPGGERVGWTIREMADVVIGPEQARTWLRDVGGASAVKGPSTVVVAGPGSIPPGLPDSAYLGSTYPVEVEVGQRRVLSLIPGIGRHFEPAARRGENPQ